MNGKNAKHIRRTHQNRIKIWIRSFQNHRNSFKTGKISENTSTQFQSTISNAPKRGQNVKNTKNRKDNSFKTEKKNTENTSTKFQSTISNAPKRKNDGKSIF